MKLIIESVVATICVIGLIGIVWWLVGRILRPLPQHATRVVLVGRGDGRELEQSIRGFYWLRSLGLLQCPILIVDVDLNPDGYELASHLAAKWPEVSLWSAQDLPRYISFLRK